MIRLIDAHLEDIDGIDLNPGKIMVEVLRSYMSEIYDKVTCPEITNILIEIQEQEIDLN